MQTIKEYVVEKKEKLKTKIASLGHPLTLYIIQVGHVPASDTYVKNKIKDAEELNVPCKLINLEDTVTEEELLALIDKLNKDNSVNGLLVQLPLPKHIDENKIKLAISPLKDVDGFHPLSTALPATPLGIFRFLQDMKFPFYSKNAVVIGSSNIVGKPMRNILADQNMNTMMLNIHTSEEDKKFYIEHADLIVVATGCINTVDSHYNIKPTAWIIDVGINRDEEGKLIGDCQRNLPVAFQSPVPGGVGLLTRLAVIENLIDLNTEGDK